MENLYMRYKRFKSIIDDFNISNLESLDIVFTNVKNQDLELTTKIFSDVLYNKLYEYWIKTGIISDGCNEYDYLTRINIIDKSKKFDISKTFDYIILNSYELVFFKKTFEDAIINIKSKGNPLEMKIIPNIEIALNKINIRLNELYDLNDIITDDELENMFNKFDVIDIEEFDYIFEYIEQYNIEKLIEISNKVKKEKIENAAKEYEVPVKPYHYNIFNLSTKKEKLDKKELEFLYILLDDAIVSLESNIEEDGSYESEKLKKSLYNLIESYSEELDNRSCKVYKKD